MTNKALELKIELEALIIINNDTVQGVKPMGNLIMALIKQQ